ncbi:MAG TPA: hypothetical protein DCZ51_03370 [Bacteroidales bacterium]|nr:hypothetical protein [Bacteroidales bacterium]
MKSQLIKSFISAGTILVFSGFCSCIIAQNIGGAVKLSYKYPTDKAVKYLNSSTMVQVMDVQGQTMQTDVTSAFGCSVKSAGSADSNLKLEFTVDTIGQTSNSPMGGSGGAVQGVKGKSCILVLTPEGKITDMSGPASLTYSIDGSGETNLSQTVGDFFPRLPENPVKTGDTWNLTDSVLTTSTSMTMKTLDMSVNKLEGFETVNGIECAKVSIQHTGTMTMNVQNQGMDIFIKGPYTGTSEYLIAVKEGYLVKLTSATKLKGNLEITSMGMEMPIGIEMKGITEMK